MDDDDDNDDSDNYDDDNDTTTTVNNNFDFCIVGHFSKVIPGQSEAPTMNFFGNR